MWMTVESIIWCRRITGMLIVTEELLMKYALIFEYLPYDDEVEVEAVEAVLVVS